MTMMDITAQNNFVRAMATYNKGIYSMGAEETVMILKCFMDGDSVYECADYLGLKDRDVFLCYHQLAGIFGLDRS